MNEQQKAMLDRRLKLQRGAAIIEGTQDKFRQDGYSNMLNKYGTAQDNSTAYQYNQEIISNDLELIRLYEGNGLFTKIIDRPSEEAVKHGFDINYGDESIAEYVDDRMDALELEEKFSTAEKWARLYGGSIIVMLVDDGRGLEEPLDWNNVRSIEELRVFERAIVQPDYGSMYHFHFMDTLNSKKKFGEPEYYQVFSIYGYFCVHRSRCLIFRNGRLPEQTTNAIYRYWGIPEYVKIKRALRECITSHEDGVKLLERSVQAIYKMKNLANMLSTEDGENKVLQRLQVIDMARGILNSIAIDTDGEDYDFKTLQMSGIKDVIDATCNMLSAVTDIPQTILFGRSPAGMNSTGESDFENYYNMVENIQKQNMKANARTVIDLILKQGALEGAIPEVPKYKMKFAALWSMSDTEKANVEQTKAQTEYTKAQTAQIYMDSNVLDPSEARKSLASGDEFEIEEVISDNDLDLPDDVFELSQTTDDPAKSVFSTGDLIEIAGTDIDKKKDDDSGIISIEVVGTGDEEINIEEQIDIELPNEDGEDFPAAAVIIIKDGKILCASRRNNEGICGPGGHAEDGETPEETAVREATEEFNIVPLNLLPVGEYKGSSGQYMPSMVYFTDQFSGTPEADGFEMMNERWLSLEELMNEQLFPPFKDSLDMLVDLLSGNNLTTSNSTDTIVVGTNQDGGSGSGNFGHGGRPGNIGGSSGSSGAKADFKAANEYSKALKGTKTVGGIEIKSVSGHAAYRMKKRGYSVDDVKEAITGAGIRYSGNKKNPDAECYQHNGTRIIVSPEGKIVSVVKLEDST
jgi:phage-related protein (TIGR01555 family)